MIAPALIDKTSLHSRELASSPDGVRMGIPDAGWTRDELDSRADYEVKKTVRNRSYAPTYWWLGKVLLLVRAEFDERGEWTAWRKKHKIDRTRAQRATRFASAFVSPSELERLTIKQADRLARERLGQPEPQSEEEQRIRHRLLQLKKKTLPDILSDLNAVGNCDRLLSLIAEVAELCDQINQAAQRDPERSGDTA